MKKRNEDKELLAEINGEVNRRQAAMTVAMLAMLVVIICGCMYLIHGMNASAMEEPVYEVSYDTEITQEQLNAILDVAPTDAIIAADEALGGQGTANEWVEQIILADPDFAETAGEILMEE